MLLGDLPGPLAAGRLTRADAPAGEQPDAVVGVWGAHRDSGVSGDLSHGAARPSAPLRVVGACPSLGPDVT